MANELNIKIGDGQSKRLSNHIYGNIGNNTTFFDEMNIPSRGNYSIVRQTDDMGYRPDGISISDAVKASNKNYKGWSQGTVYYPYIPSAKYGTMVSMGDKAEHPLRKDSLTFVSDRLREEQQAIGNSVNTEFNVYSLFQSKNNVREIDIDSIAPKQKRFFSSNGYIDILLRRNEYFYNTHNHRAIKYKDLIASMFGIGVRQIMYPAVRLVFPKTREETAEDIFNTIEYRDKKVEFSKNPVYSSIHPDIVGNPEKTRKEFAKDYYNTEISKREVQDLSSNWGEYSIDDKKDVKEYKQESKYNPGFYSFNGKEGVYEYYYGEKDTERFKRDRDAFFTAAYLNGMVSHTGDLIFKTNRLFQDGKINTLINRVRHKQADIIINKELDDYTEGYGISKGRNLLKKDANVGEANPYCRVWTAFHQYSKTGDLIRPFKSEGDMSFDRLRSKSGKVDLQEYGVLDNTNGRVKITPYSNENFSDTNTTKKYMFSIENLAWKNYTKSLSPEQQGPNGGRIMWFPPYGLAFSENINVQWSENTFIGRGEPLYTYSNTTRSGTLDFILLIDHPAVLNTIPQEIDRAREIDEKILRFFAGCDDLNSTEQNTPKTNTESETNEESSDAKPETKKTRHVFTVFFPNNFTGKDFDEHITMDALERYEKDDGSIWVNTYEDGSGNTITLTPENPNGIKDNNLYNLNTSDNSNTIKEKIKDFLSLSNDDTHLYFLDGIVDFKQKIEEIKSTGKGNSKIMSIEIKGFASSHGDSNVNENLAKERRDTLKNIIKIDGYTPTESSGEITVTGTSINDLDAKIARSAYISVNVGWDKEAKPNEESIPLEQEPEEKPAQQEDNEKIEVQESRTEKDYSNFHDYEKNYFSRLSESDPLVHKFICQKVQYFNPAFHSLTAEGFNARLNFLQQCTRQGPTQELTNGTDKGGSKFLKYGGNLAFGTPPYCILRIGDFFNTKINISSLSIQYDNGGGVQWDLNQEGAGVQPMFAKISISFNFLGGQDLSGPIERLQNAVTSNYYANTSVYDNKADNKQEYYDAVENTRFNKG